MLHRLLFVPCTKIMPSTILNSRVKQFFGSRLQFCWRLWIKECESQDLGEKSSSSKGLNVFLNPSGVLNVWMSYTALYTLSFWPLFASSRSIAISKFEWTGCAETTRCSWGYEMNMNKSLICYMYYRVGVSRTSPSWHTVCSYCLHKNLGSCGNKSCRVSWSFIAVIGSVVSSHDSPYQSELLC